MEHENVIELNGKRYDAITGELLGKSTTVVKALSAATTDNDRSIDGVHPKPQVPHPAKKQAHHRQPGTNIRPRKPEHSRTLMRHVVHKPKHSLKTQIKTQGPSEIMAKPVSDITVKHSAHTVDRLRLGRARQTPKSGHIKRFSAASQVIHGVESTAHHKRRTHYVNTAPVHRPTTAHHTSKARSNDIFEAAIARAKSHEQKHHRPHNKNRRKHRLAGTLAGITALLVAGVLAVYFNFSTIELKVASFQAGFSAQMPGFAPTGYKLKSIDNHRGTITMTFRSGDSSYAISQTSSDWNSRTLGDSITAGEGSETVQSKGRTIYFYDNHAAWVSGGIRYDLTINKASLNRNDIIGIATSI